MTYKPLKDGFDHMKQEPPEHCSNARGSLRVDEEKTESEYKRALDVLAARNASGVCRLWENE